MREVSVVGIGMVPFAKYREKTLAEIGWPAVKAAIEDAGVEREILRRLIVAQRSGG